MKAWIEKGGYLNARGRKWLSQLRVEQVRRILVIRQCAFGDMMATRPFLVELRRFFPQAHITLSTVSKYQYAVPDDLVDEVHVLDGEGALRSQWRSLHSHSDVDVLFDLADTARSRLLTLCTPARVKLGFPYRRIFNRLLFDVGILRSDFHYEAEVLLDFLKIMGHKPQYPLEFDMPRHRRVLAKPRIVYFPYAAVAEKSLSQQSWSRLIGQAAIEFPDYQHVLLEGSKREESGDFLHDVVAQHDNVVVQDRMGLESLAHWMASSSVLVSGDTGVRNLALATHTPTLGIFFMTVPFRYWPRYENCHDAVFHRDGQVPGTTDILQGLQELLIRVYPERAAPRQLAPGEA
ncbi:glycosyltransferase family 9 protein [Billgrantia endophytica]|uniref:Lipopolysaccharide biosynthesis protein n=1 Tax=Billgrantia endophytica TaxID=2033802 RepID=A0A2N7U2M9_9GAMM|nr:glycosyltransferase family 9 protein [Halomonas endophytica]PMR74682.1 lipopolysaccharide biosynthesis protein [Halomonas endophytica]